jgi:hypothetical protein
MSVRITGITTIPVGRSANESPAAIAANTYSSRCIKRKPSSASARKSDSEYPEDRNSDDGKKQKKAAVRMATSLPASSLTTSVSHQDGRGNGAGVRNQQQRGESIDAEERLVK